MHSVNVLARKLDLAAELLVHYDGDVADLGADAPGADRVIGERSSTHSHARQSHGVEPGGWMQTLTMSCNNVPRLHVAQLRRARGSGSARACACASTATSSMGAVIVHASSTSPGSDSTQTKLAAFPISLRMLASARGFHPRASCSSPWSLTRMRQCHTSSKWRRASSCVLKG